MKLVIKQHRPGRRVMVMIAGTIGIALIVGMVLDLGHWRYILGATAKNSVRRENREIREENDNLAVQIKRLTRAVAIEEDSRRELQDEILKLRNDIAELEQEVDFYRGIIAAVDTAAGPRVEGFKIAAFDQQGRYQYRIVLTYVGESDQLVEGSIILRLDGRQNGTKRELNITDMTEFAKDPLDYKFKHFQRFEGIIRIPDGFEAIQVHLMLQDKAQRKEVFRKTYSWSDLIT